MRVLIIDNNIDPTSWGSSDLRQSVRQVSKHFESGVTAFVRRGPHEDLPVDVTRFDRVIVSGSKTSAMEAAPWISKLDDLIRRAIDSGTPLLGVCYGHQALARVLAGKGAVRKAATPEIGWTKIDVTDSSKLLDGLPRSFHTFSSHFDEVADLPPGTKLLARSEACAIQAFELSGKPVFGIQFHPERDATDAEKCFVDRKKSGFGRLLMGVGQTKKLFDPAVSETLFRNFLSL